MVVGAVQYRNQLGVKFLSIVYCYSPNPRPGRAGNTSTWRLIRKGLLRRTVKSTMTLFFNTALHSHITLVDTESSDCGFKLSTALAVSTNPWTTAKKAPCVVSGKRLAQSTRNRGLARQNSENVTTKTAALIVELIRRSSVGTKSPAPAKNAKTLSPLLDRFLGGCRSFGANLRSWLFSW